VNWGYRPGSQKNSAGTDGSNASPSSGESAANLTFSDGSCLAFFEVLGSLFDFKRQDLRDLHIALGVEPETFDAMLEKAKAEARGSRAGRPPFCSVDLRNWS
jgi:hypothetical protein